MQAYELHHRGFDSVDIKQGPEIYVFKNVSRLQIFKKNLMK